MISHGNNHRPGDAASCVYFPFRFCPSIRVARLRQKRLFDKKVNALLALAIAGFSVVYEPLVETLQQYLPIAAVGLVILFFILFLKNAFGGKKEESSSNFPQIVAIAIMFLLLGVFYDKLTPYLPAGVDPTSVFWGIGIVAVVLFFWMIYKIKECKYGNT